ncbi:hypothetical protein ABW19_dt0203739 [Dactylella cylindrospora]|nr:hypothetical protein ABW19_dt0203739 [Dactylella cylindrospora]
MRVSNILSILAVAITSASALSIDISYRPRDQSPLVPFETEIPGGSPVVLCEDGKGDLVDIKKITIEPNPPVAGQNLHIEVEADVKETIEPGAKIWVEVKLGYIILIKKTFDFCDEITNIDLECPIEKGPLTVTRDEQLPKEIPPGKFQVTAKLYDQYEVQVTCLKAHVQFNH